MSEFSLYANTVNDAALALNPIERVSSTLAKADKSSAYVLWLLMLTLVVCLIPLLNLLGFSLASDSKHFDLQQLAQWNLPEEHIIDEMRYALRGGMHHALVEWSAVIIAFICSALVFVHYGISKNNIAPILTLAMVMSGSIDTLHTLAATRLIDAVADNANLVPLSWIASRCFNALVLFFGAMILLNRDTCWLNVRIVVITLLSVVLVVVAGLSYWMLFSENLPKSLFPGAAISRPYDVFPMVMFTICLPLYWKLHQQNSYFLTLAVLISLLPNIFSEAYITFGSQDVFDHYSNSAHILKVLSYLLPLLGALMDFHAIFIQRQQEQTLITQLNTSLVDAESRLRAINEQLPAGLLLVDNAGKIVTANRYTLALFEYTESELVGTSVEQLVPTESRAGHKKKRERFYQTPQQRKMAGDNDSLCGVTKSQKTVQLEIGLSPITLNNESHTLVTLLNVNERSLLIENLRQSNQQMDKAIEKLTKSNEKLEQFAFVCSHDLQEPVRMVESFSQLLEERYKDRFDKKGLEYLHYITDGANRSREMINDTLTFCRLDQTINTRERVELDEVCQRIKKMLESSLKTQNGQFNWNKPLPAINAVSSQVFQLILNLVSNGLKFNRSEVPTVILRVIDVGDYHQIQIEDNGIGIDKRYQKKIFRIFERLNGKNEFTGTGMGLAICEKIAEQNEATITLESTLGVGSKFYINWPKQYGVYRRPNITNKKDAINARQAC